MAIELKRLTAGRSFSASWPSLENILPELKTVLPNADFAIEGYVDTTEPLRDEGPFGDHTGYYTLPEPYPAYARPKLRRGEGPSSTSPPSRTGRTPSIPPMEDFYIGGAALTRPAATLSHRMGEGLGVRG